MVKPHKLKRTIAKAVSWELISNAICLWFAYWMFGNFGSCLMFTGICIALKLCLFLVHDELWHQISFGR